MLAEVADITQDNDLDRGATSVAPGTERSCALSRKRKPVSELIRFVVGPAGEAVPDIKRKLPGRGIWIDATRAAVEESVKRNVFARGFKRDVKAARDLADQTERLLESAALDALSIAGKAGLVTGGFAKVEAALGHDGVLALIHASDAAADGKRKLSGALHRNTDEKAPGNRDHRHFFRPAIGFGIKPPKCGTCSPACRPRERDFSRSRRALSALSDRKLARCS